MARFFKKRRVGFRRRRFGGRSRRRTFRRRRGTRRLSRMLTRLRRPPMELKYFDLTAPGQVISTVGSIYTAYERVPQGIDQADRIADKIFMKRFTLRMQIYYEPTLALQGATVRFILVQDRGYTQNVGVFGDPGGILTSASYQSLYNVNQFGRFRRLWDKTYNFKSTGAQANVPAEAAGAQAAYAITPSPQTFTVIKNWRNLGTMRFNAAAETTYQHGALWLLVIGDANAATTVTYDRVTRLAYTDG